MKKSPIAPLFETDAYKLGHIKMYPKGTEYVYSNFTQRSSRVSGVKHVVAFGLQAFIQSYLMDAFEGFFKAGEDEVADLYTKRVTDILGPNTIGSDHIRALHRKGYLPLHIKALKEGTLVPLQVPVLTIVNTEPEFFWLTNYIETVLSASIWHPSTTATTSVYARQLLESWAEKTGGSKEFVDWQFHDFSFRGMTSPETAAASGSGHLLSSTGTDNLNAFEWIEGYYPGDNGLIGGSVNATEHSVMCSLGEEGEPETYRRLLENFPTGILSVVSDTWDLWKVITEILPSLHEEIMGRDGKLVIRPDSGDPVDILCGTQVPRSIGMSHDYPAYNRAPHERNTPEEKGVIELLWDQFGGTINEKGFKTLDPHIGAIYGDSITIPRANEILERLAAKGFASDNIVFGAGSFLFSLVTRDTYGSVMKATWVQIDGKGQNIQKDPITANGSKKSASGLLEVVLREDGDLHLNQNVSPEAEVTGELKTVWKDGVWVRKQSFADIRATLKSQLWKIKE